MSTDILALTGELLDPAALAIVGGGTLLAVMLRSPLRDIVRAVAALRTLGSARFDAEPLLEQVTALDRIAKRHGVLALDRSVITDPDIKTAIAAIVDGAGGPAVQTLVDHRRQARVERHLAVVDVWSGAAEVAPAMGMVGTLIGLARMFATMSDPSAIGGAMAIALLATLYGALIANLAAAPIANRLRANARSEAIERARIVAPLVALAVREVPRVPVVQPSPLASVA
ncbi:MotA/TolQ/ExbB proton channel family protein [Sphingomonas sp. PB2P19]|uniref:motility protein A n=1 Tax=Sphingomonas rhamnosi TaxID=3096156 RepID=UPI002FC6943D